MYSASKAALEWGRGHLRVHSWLDVEEIPQPHLLADMWVSLSDLPGPGAVTQALNHKYRSSVWGMDTRFLGRKDNQDRHQKSMRCRESIARSDRTSSNVFLSLCHNWPMCFVDLNL